MKPEPNPVMLTSTAGGSPTSLRFGMKSSQIITPLGIAIINTTAALAFSSIIVSPTSLWTWAWDIDVLKMIGIMINIDIMKSDSLLICLENLAPLLPPILFLTMIPHC